NHFITLFTDDLYLFVKMDILNPLLCRLDTILPIEGSVEGISTHRLSHIYVKISETSVIEILRIFEISHEIIFCLVILEFFRLLNSSAQMTIVSARTESKSTASFLLEAKSRVIFDN